jgi:hypothetical protein
MERYDDALADLTESLRLNPKYARAYSTRGRAWAGKKDYAQAIADFDKAIEIDQYLLEAYYHRALTLTTTQEYDKAIVDYMTSGWRRSYASVDDRVALASPVEFGVTQISVATFPAMAISRRISMDLGRSSERLECRARKYQRMARSPEPALPPSSVRRSPEDRSLYTRIRHLLVSDAHRLNINSEFGMGERKKDGFR